MPHRTTIEKARLYNQYRLPYTPELVPDLLRHTGDAPVVADIGAGTGQLARLLAPHSERVYAIEPDAAMRHVAAEALAGYANITLIDASAEQTTLATDSVDLIVVGNAYHRFPDTAPDELRRILKPGGWVALVSFRFTDPTFIEMLFPKLGELASIKARSAQNWHSLPVEALFGDHPLQTWCYPQSVTEDWTAFWGSVQSGIEAPSPGEADFARFEAINRGVFDALSVDGQLRIEYETRALCGQPNLIT